MISEQLLKLVRCPECRAQLSRRPEASGVFVCSGCGREYRGTDDYLDMRPIEQFTERTKYLDEALHLFGRRGRGDARGGVLVGSGPVLRHPARLSSGVRGRAGPGVLRWPGGSAGCRMPGRGGP